MTDLEVDLIRGLNASLRMHAAHVAAQAQMVSLMRTFGLMHAHSLGGRNDEAAALLDSAIDTLEAALAMTDHAGALVKAEAIRIGLSLEDD